ncbi:hypothetical protein N182_13640 [Sinorhizobium sp. GL2]|nr:hypothetical protein N182_13640 [Sinorhizobium sp. GL2]
MIVHHGIGRMQCDRAEVASELDLLRAYLLSNKPTLFGSFDLMSKRKDQVANVDFAST